MLKREKSVVIHRPVDEVFAYVSDIRHSPEWQAAVVEVHKTTEGPLGVGSKFTFARMFLGKKLEANNEFIAYEPNSIVTFKFYGAIPGEASYLFEAAAEGTKLTSTVQMNPAGFSRLAEPFIAASLGREMDVNLVELKRLLEAPSC